MPVHKLSLWCTVMPVSLRPLLRGAAAGFPRTMLYLPSVVRALLGTVPLILAWCLTASLLTRWNLIPLVPILLVSRNVSMLLFVRATTGLTLLLL